jgi:hypothetical protein
MAATCPYGFRDTENTKIIAAGNRNRYFCVKDRNITPSNTNCTPLGLDLANDHGILVWMQVGMGISPGRPFIVILLIYNSPLLFSVGR